MDTRWFSLDSDEIFFFIYIALFGGHFVLMTRLLQQCQLIGNLLTIRIQSEFLHLLMKKVENAL